MSLAKPPWEPLSSALLADVLDGLGHRASALPPHIRPLRPSYRACGPAATLLFHAVTGDPELPYAVEMECIDSLRPGEVLVAGTNGSTAAAIWGELLSTAARARSAVGAVMDGLTRDAARIVEMDFPVWASGFSPLDSRGRLDSVAHGQPVRMGDCIVHPGDWVFADLDGVVCVPQSLADEAFRRALAKCQGENVVRAELARGRRLKDVFADHGIL